MAMKENIPKHILPPFALQQKLNGLLVDLGQKMYIGLYFVIKDGRGNIVLFRSYTLLN